jgi:phosphonopyruvate decarboxylase
MLSPEAFVSILKQASFKDFTGVPCSFFQSAINCVIADEDLQYTISPNEGSALAFAAGKYLAQIPSVVFIQNSGFGNLINPLTSLNMIYNIPVLIFMSGRAYGVDDEPQHEIMGAKMTAVLDQLNVAYREMPTDEKELKESLEEIKQYFREKKQPYFFIVKKGSIGNYKSPEKQQPDLPLSRYQAIEIIAKSISPEDYVISTTGKPSRELFAIADRPRNFYMQGSMGHAPAIALGVADALKEERVIALDGDGALLMHLGVMSSIGHYGLKNFFHILLDNEAYETTGDQDTTSSTTDFTAIAKACGYTGTLSVANAEDLEASLQKMKNKQGPFLLHIHINRKPTSGVPRITTKYKAHEITENFLKNKMAGKLK